MNNFTQITQRLSAEKILQGLNSEDILLFSETSLKLIGNLHSGGVLVNGSDFHSRIEDIDNFLRYLPDGERVVYTLGGGTIIDTGKYMANRLDTRLVCILPMLSTNTFATDKVSLYLHDGTKMTLQAKVPDEIVLDMTLLQKAGHRNLLGLSDVLSIYTALYDWSLGNRYNNEIIDEDIYTAAEEIFVTLEENIDGMLSFNAHNIMAIYELIGQSGEITKEYGSGRPESGSEHIFAKIIEKELPIPHGIAVAIGVIGMSMLQENNPARVVSLIKKIGTLGLLNNYNITNEDIALALRTVKKLDTRFTILDVKSIDEDFIERVLWQVSELRR